MKNIYGGVLFKSSNFTKSNIPLWVFLLFWNCTNGTKSCKASHMFLRPGRCVELYKHLRWSLLQTRHLAVSWLHQNTPSWMFGRAQNTPLKNMFEISFIVVISTALKIQIIWWSLLSYIEFFSTQFRERFWLGNISSGLLCQTCPSNRLGYHC